MIISTISPVFHHALRLRRKREKYSGKERKRGREREREGKRERKRKIKRNFSNLNDKTKCAQDIMYVVRIDRCIA
jgi:hypothetical protein